MRIRPSKRTRRAALIAVHTVGSSVWLGMLIVLAIAQASTLRDESGLLIALDGTIVSWTLIPTVAIVLCTGLTLAGPWGLAKHWWLLAKSFIAAVLSVAGIAAMLTPIPTFYARCGAVAALGAATVLSVIKPWGKTPFGRPPSKHQRVATG